MTTSKRRSSPRRAASGQSVSAAQRPRPGSKRPTYLAPATAAQWLAALADISEVGAYKRLSYELLDLVPGWRVLEVGCGLGDDARALARRVAPDGAVTGVDADARMIEAALARQPDQLDSPETSPLPVPVQFAVAQVERLPFDDASFDAVRVDRVLQHVAEPRLAIQEIHRVLCSGGRVVVVEPDWKTMAVYPGSPAGEDDDRTIAAILQWQVTHTLHPTIGRQLRALLSDGGFHATEVYPVAYATYQFAVADLVLELSAAAEAATAAEPPLLMPGEAQAWIEAARLADTQERFFASVPLLFARALKSL